MNRCNVGPVMLVEPGHVMYAGLDKAKIDRIIDEHIIGGKPVEEYIIPDELWGDPVSPEEMMKQMGR
jgi:(2Fe-2S) ferredoxin